MRNPEVPMDLKDRVIKYLERVLPAGKCLCKAHFGDHAFTASRVVFAVFNVVGLNPAELTHPSGQKIFQDQDWGAECISTEEVLAIAKAQINDQPMKRWCPC